MAGQIEFSIPNPGADPCSGRVPGWRHTQSRRQEAVQRAPSSAPHEPPGSELRPQSSESWNAQSVQRCQPWKRFADSPGTEGQISGAKLSRTHPQGTRPRGGRWEEGKARKAKRSSAPVPTRRQLTGCESEVIPLLTWLQRAEQPQPPGPGPIRSHPEGACAMALQPSSVSRPLMS